MGKQIRFFMERDDERNFLEGIRAIEPYDIIRTSYKSYEERVVPIENVSGLEGNLSIYNLALVRTIDAKKIKTTQGSSGDNCNIDLANSPVVQFNRCQPISTWIKNGRLWYQETWLSARNHLEKKDADFCQWAETVLRWIKRNYTHLPQQACYVGPIAKKAAAEGRLHLGPPQTSTLSPEERRRILGLDT